ncbi:MAG: DNA repair protein RecO [Sedimentisphaerales bacterium]|nr:DNA repair protein RecO [Sedimentisphaerales bacterium]
MLEKDEALCIRTLDYSETSQIVTLFTKDHGKIDAMAKGAKRAKSPFGGTIEIFSCGEIVFTDKGDQKLSTLAEFNQRPLFLGLRTRLFSLNCSLFAAELLDLFTLEYDPHPELFDEMMLYLQNQLESNNQQQSLAQLISFQLLLLRQIGGGLVLDHCTNCKMAYNAKWPTVYFSSSSHGLVCRDCEASFADKVRLDKNAAEFLATEDTEIKKTYQTQINTDYTDLNKIEKVLIYHFTNLLHRPPKMAVYFA